MVYPHGQGKLSQCEQFADGGGGQFFGILCKRLLWRPLIEGIYISHPTLRISTPEIKTRE